MNTTSRKLSRRELAAYLTEHGYPISVHTLNRLCGPAVNQGPQPAGQWGNRHIYDPPTGLEWAERRAGVNRDVRQPTPRQSQQAEAT